MHTSDEEIGEVISTMIEVLDALAMITIKDIGVTEQHERKLGQVRVRINLILNILDTRKRRRPVLATVNHV
jgi:hypothetical protein